MKLTVPIGATNVSQEGVKRAEWSESSFSGFDANLDRAQYVEWVTNKLKSEFNLVKSSGDSLAFAKNLGSHAETIVIHLNPDRENLHVRVSVKVVPD